MARSQSARNTDRRWHAPVPRSARASLDDALLAAIADIETSIGVVAVDAAPLWTPLPPQPGRGLSWYDGRILSPQQAAMETPADELAFGGAPGGGKTDLVLGLSVTQHRSTGVFRRQLAQFKGPEGMIARSQQIIGLRGKQANNTWRDMPGGRALEFLGCDYEKDVLKYLGRPHDLKAFEEATEIPENYYRRLIGWMRTAVEGQRTRAVCTFNPPTTPEGQWVIRYWAPWLDPLHPNPAREGELRWFVVGEDGKDIEVPGPKWGSDRAPAVQVGDRRLNPRSRTFIRSQVEDNPIYLRTGYANVLDSLPEPYRSQLRFGSFTAGIADHEWQVIPTAWIKSAQDRWTPDGGLDIPLSCVGNDPSRGGGDEFVLAPRHDNWVGRLVVLPGSAVPDGPIGAKELFRLVGGDREVPLHIDIIGTAGASVYDAARLLKLNAVAFNGSERSKARDKSGRLGFVNRRAEWHWRMREALDPASGLDLALPPDAQLLADLAAPRWTPTIRGIQIEEKEQIKKRIGRSPDRGEATMYACVRVDSTARHGLLFAAAPDVDAAEDELRALKEQLGIMPAAGNGNGSHA